MRNSLNVPIRAAAITTTSYVDSTVVDNVQKYNQVVFYTYYTKGSLTSLNVKVQSSIDGTNYVDETNITVSGADITLNNGVWNTIEDGNFKISLPMGANFVKITYQGVGTVTGSSVEAHAFLQEA